MHKNSGYSNGSIAIWNTDGECLKIIEDKKNSPLIGFCNSKNDLLCAGYMDGTIVFYDSQNQWYMDANTCEGVEGELYCLVDWDEEIWTGFSDGTIRIWKEYDEIYETRQIYSSNSIVY
jgi:WD40 repeat protein